MCRYVLIGFCVLYGAALAAWLAGTVGWFIDKDPLSGVFLVILGQPWVRWIDTLPENAWPVAAALTPAVNAGIIAAICRLARSK